MLHKGHTTTQKGNSSTQCAIVKSTTYLLAREMYLGDVMMTTEQVENLWRAASSDAFLAKMCECWLDADGDTRASYDATIRSHIKGSRLQEMVR